MEFIINPGQMITSHIMLSAAELDDNRAMEVVKGLLKS